MTISMKDNTQMIRTRQSAARHWLTLTICALLALAGLIGWLSTLK